MGGMSMAEREAYHWLIDKILEREPSLNAEEAMHEAADMGALTFDDEHAVHVNPGFDIARISSGKIEGKLLPRRRGIPEQKSGSIRKARVRSHYRRLANGKLVWIEEYRDKRKDAQSEPSKFRHEAVHADDSSTTVVHGGKLQTYPHHSSKELQPSEIHSHLNQTVPVDEDLAWKMYLHGVRKPKGDHPRHLMAGFGTGKLDDALKEAVEAGEDLPKSDKTAVKDKAGARDAIHKHIIKPLTKELQAEHGEFTTHAKLADSRDGERLNEETLDSPHAHYHDKAMARMAQSFGASALDAAERRRAAIERAKTKTSADAPKIPYIASGIKAFDHQAEVLAKLNELPDAIVDVDMGGGKGFLLPADAVNLIAQGKVKRPLIVATGMTLDQNAEQTLRYFDGKMNVFVISNANIKKHYGGDVQAMIADIEKAPPNTLFMTSYDVLGYNPDAGGDPEMQYARAQALAAAGFDYVACDESQKVKNPKSGRFKALQFFSRAAYKRLATGTFISKDPMDVVGQLAWLDPGSTPSMAEFAKTYGFEETPKGFKWSDKGMDKLHEDLQDRGYIGIRRSRWMNLLPPRNEKPNVVKMDAKSAIANELAISDAMDALDDLAASDPKIAAEIERLNSEVDDDAMPSGRVVDALNTLTGITDHPDLFAKRVAEAKKICDDAGVEYEFDPDAWKRSQGDEPKDEDDEEENAGSREEIPQDVRSAQSYLKKFRPKTLQAILNLDGVVSAKAKHCYDVMREHMKDEKNGKFIVFTTRIKSTRHIFDNMPDDLKSKAVYYDGSNKEGLEPFLGEGGPQIIVACDPSIKEGVNMQMANGMYRYDFGWTPGDTEQSYGRIWRFGQKRPCNIHIGLTDNSVDITKYARLMSRMNSNMKAVSEYDEIPELTAYRMSTKNIRENRGEDLVPEYAEVSSAILNFQKQENTRLTGGKPTPQRDIGSDAEIKGSAKGVGPAYAGQPVENKKRTPREKAPAPTSKKPEQDRNEAARHHLTQAAAHHKAGNRELALQHWSHAVRHLKSLPKDQRDRDLVKIAKDKEAFGKHTEKVQDKPKRFKAHELDSVPSGAGKDSASTQLGRREATMQSVKELGFADMVDEESLKELVDDVGALSKHLRAGKDAKSFWRQWAGKYGGSPAKEQESGREIRRDHGEQKMKFKIIMKARKPAPEGTMRKWGSKTYQKHGRRWDEVVLTKHVKDSATKHGLDHSALDKDTMKEVHEDIHALEDHMAQGGTHQSFWTKWTAQHGRPSKYHKNIVSDAHTRVHEASTPQDEDEKPKLVEKKQKITVKPKLKAVGSKVIGKLPEHATHDNRTMVQGDSGNKYIMARRKSSGNYECSCPGWIYHRKCKHMDRHLDEVKALHKEGRKAKPEQIAQRKEERKVVGGKGFTVKQAIKPTTMTEEKNDHGEKVLSKIDALAKKNDGIPWVPIGDVAPTAEEKKAIIDMAADGDVALSRGDWSMSSPEDKKHHIEINGVKHVLIRSFRKPKENNTKDSDVRSGADSAIFDDKRSDGEKLATQIREASVRLSHHTNKEEPRKTKHKWTIKYHKGDDTEGEIGFNKKPSPHDVHEELRRREPSIEYYNVDLVDSDGNVTNVKPKKKKPNKKDHPMYAMGAALARISRTAFKGESKVQMKAASKGEIEDHKDFETLVKLKIINTHRKFMPEESEKFNKLYEKVKNETGAKPHQLMQKIGEKVSERLDDDKKFVDAINNPKNAKKPMRQIYREMKSSSEDNGDK